MSLEERSQKDLVLYSPKNCFKHAYKLKTVLDVLRHPSVSLTALNRLYGSQWLIGYITVWLIDLNDFLNVKNKMNDAQILFTAEAIINEVPLNITDLTFFFKSIKSGKFGALYENLSSDKIITWLHLYFNERCEAAEMMNSQKNTLDNRMHPDVAKEISKSLKDIKEDIPVQPNPLGTRERGKFHNEVKKLIASKTTEELQQFLMDVDESSPGYSETVMRFVEAEMENRRI